MSSVRDSSTTTMRALDACRRRSWWLWLIALAASLNARSAAAYSNYPKDYFASAIGCPACHDAQTTETHAPSPTNLLNPFGNSWKNLTACYKVSWSAPICVGSGLKDIDSDLDGFSNGQEVSFGTSPGLSGDVNECQYPSYTQCTTAMCKDKTSAKGDFTCACPVGYDQNGTGLNATCNDKNECAATPNGGCDVNATCLNTPGSYSCNCNAGYFGNGKVLGGCTQTDSCHVANPPCSALSTCSPVDATTYTCGACPTGYSGAGAVCTDSDECANDNGGCDAHVTCSNVPGGRVCGKCPVGYIGDGATGCSLIDCQSKGCGAFGVCDSKDADGCACVAGFEGDGKTCTDVDECKKDPCGKAACRNLPGTFTCSCVSSPAAAAALPRDPPRHDGERPMQGLWWWLPAALVTAFLSLSKAREQRTKRNSAAALVFAGALTLWLAAACGSSDGGSAESAGASGVTGASGAAGESVAGTSSEAGADSAGASGVTGASGASGANAAGANEAGASGATMVTEPGKGCARTCECDAGDWCNPANQRCESRTPPVPVDFRDVRAMLGRVGCLSCHYAGGSGDVDPRKVGAHLLLAGDTGAAYSALIAGGVNCAAGANRLCVDEPASSLLATQALDIAANQGKPSVAFSSWSDPDLQVLLRWVASGAPRGPLASGCGDHILQAGEECDEGLAPATQCQYGTATCTLCNTSCKQYAATGPTCGDGALDAAHEACDDANLSVEQVGLHGAATCGPNCTYVAGTPCGGEGQACCTTGTACGSVLDECRNQRCLPIPPSCVGLANNCGPGESCCTSPLVAGGTFYRGYDGVTTNYTSQAYPATVSSFRLDKYEVTIGRFRNFINAWVGGWRPAAGAGKHVHLNSGLGLGNTAGGFEGGWDASWSANLASTSTDWNTNLKCVPWTATPGANETSPVPCISWYELHAFCIWDGGFLPSDAEFNYAQSGGAEQRVYPWSNPANSTTNDCTFATCTTQPSKVGSQSPKGDGKFGQADLTSNATEWALDYYTDKTGSSNQEVYPTPCSNCAALSTVNWRVMRSSSLSAARIGTPAGVRNYFYGGRCARPPTP